MIDFPTHLQIQTTAACGAACSICPHPVESPKWSNGLMDDALFRCIVDQLGGRDIQYVSPYLMADPLSDKKIFDRIAALRRAVPEAHIEVSTTGMYLVPRLAERLLASPLSELRISSHGITAEEYARTMPGVDFEKAMAHIMAFIERWRAHRPYPLSVVCLWGLFPPAREAEIESFWQASGVELSRWRVTSRARQVDLTIHAGASPDPTRYRDGRGEPPYRCRFHRDTHWLHILSDGRVTLCCMDYRQEVIVGDARKQSLEDIWNSDVFQRVRGKVRGSLAAEDDFPCHRCEWHISESIAGPPSRGLEARANVSEPHGFRPHERIRPAGLKPARTIELSDAPSSPHVRAD